MRSSSATVNSVPAEVGHDLFDEWVAGHGEPGAIGEASGPRLGVGQRHQGVQRGRARVPRQHVEAERAPARWATTVSGSGSIAAATSAITGSGVAMTSRSTPCAAPARSSSRPSDGATVHPTGSRASASAPPARPAPTTRTLTSAFWVRPRVAEDTGMYPERKRRRSRDEDGLAGEVAGDEVGQDPRALLQGVGRGSDGVQAPRAHEIEQPLDQGSVLLGVEDGPAPHSTPTTDRLRSRTWLVATLGMPPTKPTIR